MIGCHFSDDCLERSVGFHDPSVVKTNAGFSVSADDILDIIFGNVVFCEKFLYFLIHGRPRVWKKQRLNSLFMNERYRFKNKNKFNYR